MFNPIYLSEGLRMFRRARRVKKQGIHEYEGNAQEICQQIINDCWNGSYFQASTGHFCQFWTRDFGWCVESLLQLGYREKVTKTLDYALSTFRKHNNITTAISPDGIPFDFPTYAVDSVPYIVRGLRLTKDDSLLEKYRDFLNQEIQKFCSKVLHAKTGLVKNKHFSSMKDHAIRNSSCYDNTMVAMLNQDLKKIHALENPLVQYDLERKIMDSFWRDTHFIDDLSGKDIITGDANVFPFWTGVITSRAMLNSVIKKITELELDKPFPLRYYHTKFIQQKMHPVELFSKGYERDTVWMHMGPLYIKTVRKVHAKLAQEYLSRYTKLIEQYHTYLEVFNSDGTPFKTYFYHADEGMLWSSIYLELVKK